MATDFIRVKSGKNCLGIYNTNSIVLINAHLCAVAMQLLGYRLLCSTFGCRHCFELVPSCVICCVGCQGAVE